MFYCSSWDTLYYSHAEFSVVSNIPQFFNISLCGPLLDSACGNSSSVCYSSNLEPSNFYNLGNTTSRRTTYAGQTVTVTYTYSSEEKVRRLYGTRNVTITLICGRTLVSCMSLQQFDVVLVHIVVIRPRLQLLAAKWGLEIRGE